MVVNPQSMRGLHATLARDAGETGHAVAGQLGHESEAMHEVAYAETSAIAAGNQDRVLEVTRGRETLESAAKETPEYFWPAL